MGEQESFRQVWPYLAARIERMEAQLCKQEKVIDRLKTEIHKIKTKDDYS